MAALDDFLKQNVSGPLNKVFLAGYIRDIAVADNKWKAVGQTILSVAAWSTRLVLPAVFISAWLQIGKTVRAILMDTGSLDAAFKRLAAIQGFQRSFAPLLGGLAAAKQRVAELVQFSSRQKFFKFEDIGEGARNLEVMTRGVYSGNEALLHIQNAAVSSGNGFSETADAVSKFYADLREGQPIDAAAERLRQMGVISNQTAGFLDDLQKSGAGVNEVFDGLKGALAGVKPPEAGEDLATVQQRRDQAGEQLKQTFGKPFTHDEIQNTKNYTDALNAIAPSVGRVASFFSILSDGLSTVKSSIARTAAESKPLQMLMEGLAKALGVVAAAAFVVGALSFPVVLGKWAIALRGATGALAAVRIGLLGLSVATGIGAFVAVVGTAIGVIMNLRRVEKEIAREVMDMARAHREAQAAIEGQAAAVKTLSDRNEVLAASIQSIIGLEQKLADLRSGTQKPTPQRKAQEGELEREIKDAKQKQQALLAAGTEGLQGPAREQFITAQLEKTRALRRGAFQAAIEGQAPEGRLEVRRKQVEELKEQERQAEEGLNAGKEAERVRAQREQELAQAQQKAEEARVEMRRRQQLFPKGEAKENPEARRILEEGRQNVKQAEAEVTRQQTAVAQVGLAPVQPKVLTDEAKAKVAELQKQLDAIKGPEIKPHVLTDEAKAKVTDLQRQMEAIRSPAPAKPVVLTDEAKSKIAELQKQINAIQPSSRRTGLAGFLPFPSLVLTDKEKAKIAELQSQIDKLKSPTIEPVVLTDEAKSKIAELQKQIDAIQTQPSTSPVQNLIDQGRIGGIKSQEIKPVVLTDEAKAKVADLQKQIDAIKGPKVEVGFAAPKTSSVFAEAMARAIQNSIAASGIEERIKTLGEPKTKDEREERKGLTDQATRLRAMSGGVTGTPQDLFNWQYYAAQQRQLEQQLPQLAEELQGAQAALRTETREERVRRIQSGLGIEGIVAETGVTPTGVVGKVDTKKAERIEDTLDFAKRFEENISQGLSEAEARSRAMSETAAGIAGKTNLVGPAVVASSLQRIGGGGGVYAPGGDQMTRLQERLVRLTETANVYLKQVADAKEGVH